MADNIRGWISIVTAIGAFLVSALSIYLGYRLFLVGATGGFTIFSSQKEGFGFYLGSTAPGLGFALFGMCISIFALWKLIGKNS